MPVPKYDAAISFLSADEPIAAALHARLNESLDVFFFPRRQEELAGTDGMESMRSPFLDDSRVVVVLFRERWGETPWTRIEQTAIQERCLKHGWKGLFFIMLDKSLRPPKWLPENHVWFSYSDYGVEQAVGAIKARVQETGGVVTSPNALKHAAIAREETEFQNERDSLRSPLRGNVVAKETDLLFKAIKGKCDEVNVGGNAEIQVAVDSRQCHLRNDRVSLTVRLTESAAMTPELVVNQYSKRLPMGRENLIYLYVEGHPKIVGEEIFLPDLNRAGEYGWSLRARSDQFLSMDALADRIVIKFIDHAARADRRRSRSAGVGEDD